MVNDVAASVCGVWLSIVSAVSWLGNNDARVAGNQWQRGSSVWQRSVTLKKSRTPTCLTWRGVVFMAWRHQWRHVAKIGGVAIVPIQYL